RVVYDPAEAAALRTGSGAADGVLDSAAAATGTGEQGAPPLVPIASWTSAPLSEIVAAILKPSQNWIAEMLLKTLGAERGEGGSWPAGLEVERRYLFDVVGIDSTAVVLRDASGLSAQNLLTPRAIVQLLEHARRMPWGPVYRAALAVPGEKDGTLERRLVALEGRLFAKTGTIAHVNSLSGYLTTASGGELVFSILSNASGRPAAEVRRAIDANVNAAADQAGGPCAATGRRCGWWGWWRWRSWPASAGSSCGRSASSGSSPRRGASSRCSAPKRPSRRRPPRPSAATRT